MYEDHDFDRYREILQVGSDEYSDECLAQLLGLLSDVAELAIDIESKAESDAYD